MSAEDFPKVPLVLDGISSRFIRENRIIPIELKNGVLKVILGEPGRRGDRRGPAGGLGRDVIVYSGDSQAIDEYMGQVLRAGITEHQPHHRGYGSGGARIHPRRRRRRRPPEGPRVGGAYHQALQSAHHEGDGEQGKRYPHRAF